MDLVLKGRGVRITARVRASAEHKLAKIGRVDPRVTRLEVEVTRETNPRITESHRVEVACSTARHVFRASAGGSDVDSALDKVIDRLESQLASYRSKLRRRRQPPAL